MTSRRNKFICQYSPVLSSCGPEYEPDPKSSEHNIVEGNLVTSSTDELRALALSP